jgi:SAM-dependent methyltransferase
MGTEENSTWFGRAAAFDFLEKDRDNQLRLARVERFLRERARRREPGELLDVGAGDGRVGARFARLGYQVTGVDAAPENVRACREHGLSAELADASRPLPFDSGRFDVVVAGEIIEHLLETLPFLEELRRVTRPGGTVIVTTPNLAHLPDRLRLLLGGTPTQTQPLHPFLKLHIRPFTRASLRSALGAAGLKVEHVESTLVVWARDPRDPDRVRLASRFLARAFPSLGSFLIAYATRPPAPR